MRIAQVGGLDAGRVRAMAEDDEARLEAGDFAEAELRQLGIALFGGAFLALALSAISSVALADGRGPGGHRHDPASLVQRFDANKDGKLQVTELPERMRARLNDARTRVAGFRDELKGETRDRVRSEIHDLLTRLNDEVSRSKERWTRGAKGNPPSS